MIEISEANEKAFLNYYLYGQLASSWRPEPSSELSPARIVLLAVLKRGYFTALDRAKLANCRIIPSSKPRIRWYTQDELPAIREEKQARPFYPKAEDEKPFTSREKDLIRNALNRVPVSFLDSELQELATGGYINPERVVYAEWTGDIPTITGHPLGQPLPSILSIKNIGNGSKQ